MIKVMIVDDDINVRNCLRKLIPWTELGYNIVAEAGDGKEGLKRFIETRPDVIITDLKMPEMDGETFCQRIRQISDQVAIIFLSAYENFSAAQLSLHYGVSEYILKPLDTKKMAQITEILKSLSYTINDAKLLHGYINTSEWNTNFCEQLRKKNITYFEEFFQNFIHHTNRNFALTQSTANALINLLFCVMEESAIDASAIVEKHKNALIQLNSFSRKTDITSYTYELFNEYLHQEENSARNLTNNVFNHTLIEKVKAYIMENIHDSQLNVSVVADYFNFSDDYLGRIFKIHTGTTLISYITHIRLNQACRLLKNTHLTIGEIALAVGYSNSNYFCRIFKKQLNITPNEYRNHY